MQRVYPPVKSKQTQFIEGPPKEAAAKLAPEDSQALATLPTLNVFDLRSVRERNELSSPYLVNERATLLTVDVPHSSGAADMIKTMNEMMDAEPGALESYMHVTYRQFPQQFAETLRDLLQRSVHQPDYVLHVLLVHTFHCGVHVAQRQGNQC